MGVSRSEEGEQSGAGGGFEVFATPHKGGWGLRACRELRAGTLYCLFKDICDTAYLKDIMLGAARLSRTAGRCPHTSGYNFYMCPPHTSREFLIPPESMCRVRVVASCLCISLVCVLRPLYIMCVLIRLKGRMCVCSCLYGGGQVFSQENTCPPPERRRAGLDIPLHIYVYIYIYFLSGGGQV